MIELTRYGFKVVARAPAAVEPVGVKNFGAIGASIAEQTLKTYWPKLDFKLVSQSVDLVSFEASDAATKARFKVDFDWRCPAAPLKPSLTVSTYVLPGVSMSSAVRDAFEWASQSASCFPTDLSPDSVSEHIKTLTRSIRARIEGAGNRKVYIFDDEHNRALGYYRPFVMKILNA